MSPVSHRIPKSGFGELVRKVKLPFSFGTGDRGGQLDLAEVTFSRHLLSDIILISLTAPGKRLQFSKTLACQKLRPGKNLEISIGLHHRG